MKNITIQPSKTIQEAKISLESEESLKNLFVNSSQSRPLYCIVAPNFEERSCHLVEIAPLERSPHVHWIVFTLQGDHPPEIMDAIKAKNTRYILNSLLAHSQESQIQHKLVKYPVSGRSFRHLISYLLRNAPTSYDLVIDYSSIPRNFLFDILDMLLKAGSDGSPIARPDNIYLSYTWADSYPLMMNSEFIGDISGQYTGASLSRLLSRKTHVELVVFTGGNVHDAYRTVSLAKSSGLGANLNINLVNFFRKEHLRLAQTHLREHYDLINQLQSIGSKQVRYVYGIRHAIEFMREVAHECFLHRKENSETMLLFAPYGPKVLGVAAHFVRDEYLRMVSNLIGSENRNGDRLHLDEAEVLNSCGSQYLSVYSLGMRGPITVLKYGN